MRPFTYVRAADEAGAIGAGAGAETRFLAGGTTLVDLMRLGVERPATVVDLGPLPLAGIDDVAGGGLRIGALARNSAVAAHPSVVKRYPVLSQALLAGASPQVRNMATVGGNLLQRTRCSYFRNPAMPCNKRDPGSGCSAWDGFNRMHAVLGGSERCIAVNPSDMNVALVALDAAVHTRGPTVERHIPIGELHVLPGERPEVESVLQPGELIVAVELPATPFAARSVYVKVRDRASFAFALASAAVALHIDGGTIRAARVALGGVATKPWRSPEAEAVLVGKRPSRPLWKEAAAAALRGAQPRPHNAFKVELAQRTLARALAMAGGIK